MKRVTYVAGVTQYTHQKSKQTTNMDHVKEFVSKTLIITIREVVKRQGISCVSIQTTLKYIYKWQDHCKIHASYRTY